MHLQTVEGVNLYETIKDEVAISLHVLLKRVGGVPKKKEIVNKNLEL